MQHRRCQQKQTETIKSHSQQHSGGYKQPAPINMNVTYKKSSMSIHNNHHHYHHHHKQPPNSKQAPINVHYHLYRSNHNHMAHTIPTLPNISHRNHTHQLPLPLPHNPTQCDFTSYMTSVPSATNSITSITTVPRSSSITSLTSIQSNDDMTSELIKNNNNYSSYVSHVSKENNNCSNNSNSNSNKKRISFPTGDKYKDKYIGLKRIGAGTFADIWEVYDQYDPKGKHYAIKVLKKSKCISKEKNGQIDGDKYIKYTNAMIAEGNRILRLNNYLYTFCINLTNVSAIICTPFV